MHHKGDEPSGYSLERRSGRHPGPQRRQHVPHARLLLVLRHASLGIRARRPSHGHGREEVQTREVLRPPIRSVPSGAVVLKPGDPELVGDVGRVRAGVSREKVDEEVVVDDAFLAPIEPL